MAKKVILAVAGAGKTYHICHEIDPNKRNLILAYTHENIHNIQNELCKEHGCIPELTTVSTFDSFVYHQLILPYEPSIAEHFDKPGFISQGISTITPPKNTIRKSTGTHSFRKNPLYVRKNKLEHYISKQSQYYCETLSELVLQVKGKASLVERGAIRMNLFYDCVLIDEFQDFREFDYDLIIKMAKLLTNVVLVGDYYQHSVSAINNSGKPFKKGTRNIGFDSFVEELKKNGFEVDLTTLDKSRRCSVNVCDYISKKLHIKITSNGDHNGDVIWVDENTTSVLNNNQIIKLVFKEADKYSFKSLNWSYSKGDTFSSVCVVLTEAFENLNCSTFNPKEVNPSTINKLYVAMTRSCGNLYLIKSSTFKKYKNEYLK